MWYYGDTITMSRTKDPNRKVHVTVTLSQGVMARIHAYRNDTKNTVQTNNGPEKPSRSGVIESALMAFLGSYIPETQNANS